MYHTKKIALTSVAAAALTASSALAQDIRIDVWPDIDSHLEQVIPGFEGANAGIAVTYQANNHGDHHKKLTTNLATGEGAGDVVAVDVGFVGSFVNAGGFVNLSDPAYGAEDMNGLFAEYAWNQGKGTDGNQYAIPLDIGPGVMYYRRDVLGSINGDIDAVITDWDSYIDYGRKLKDQNVALIADAGDVAIVIINTTVKEGEGLYFDAEGNSLVTSDRFVTAFETAKTIREEGLDAQIGSWSNEWYDAFKGGTVATQMSGAWLLGHLQNWMAPDTAGLWGASHLPNGIYGSWGGSFLAIPQQSENKEAAWEMIKYLTTSSDIQLAGLAKIGAFPVLESTYTDASFDEPIAFLDGQQARQLFAEVAKQVPAVLPMEGDLIARDVVNAALAEVLNDGKDVASALADAERLILRRVR